MSFWRYRLYLRTNGCPIVSMKDVVKCSFFPFPFVLKKPVKIMSDGVQIAEIPNSLPSIKLQFSFPSNYPSESAPQIAVSCDWFDESSEDHLGQTLEALFVPGEPIVYNAYECTKELYAYSDGGEISIPQPGVCLKMIQHDLRAFNASVRSNGAFCNICFESVKGSDLILFGCRHPMCTECLRRFAKVHIYDGTVENLKCPMCAIQIIPRFIRPLLSNEEVERWERLLLQKSLIRCQTLLYCPRCSPPVATIAEDNCAKCTKCRFAFCVLCLNGWHGGTKCIDYNAKLSQLRRRAKK